MTDWRKHFDELARAVDPTDFLRQVGKTVGGVPIDMNQFKIIPRSIQVGLDINSEDQVLDMCCGNGLVTHAIATMCRKITGMDFSAELIGLAKRFHGGEQITYICDSLLDDSFIDSHRLRGVFNKAFMYEAIQCFQKDQLQHILERLKQCLISDGRLMVAGIPDQGRIWSFYNTPERKAVYHSLQAQGRDPIGTWWTRNEFKAAAEEAGFRCALQDQNPALHTAHYRFDAILATS